MCAEYERVERAVRNEVWDEEKVMSTETEEQDHDLTTGYRIWTIRPMHEQTRQWMNSAW